MFKETALSANIYAKQNQQTKMNSKSEWLLFYILPNVNKVSKRKVQFTLAPIISQLSEYK